MRYKPAKQTDAVPAVALDIGNIEIVIDYDHVDKIELYILDQEGNRIEGGTFDKNAFMMHVGNFYRDNY